MAADRRVWIILAFLVMAAALSLDVLVRHDRISFDFHTYVAAGQVGLQRGWSHIYDQELVAAQQRQVAPQMRAQPFLSPPLVAFLAAPLGLIPYNTAYAVWAAFVMFAYAAALAWAGLSKGWSRWLAVAGALTPWWVMHAIEVGQVVPLVAATTVLGWQLIRARREILAGIVLGLILFKPHVAILVPFALLFAARFRAFAAWTCVAVATTILILLIVGPHSMTNYLTQLSGPWPRGAEDLTLHGALGATGLFATELRLLIVGAVFAASFKLRHSPGMVVPIAIVGSLVIAPYLHSNDLCMLSVAGWMVWEERPVLAWRVPVGLGWILASPFVYVTGYGPQMQQWPWFELALLLALVIAAWWPLTAWADSRRRAPA